MTTQALHCCLNGDTRLCPDIEAAPTAWERIRRCASTSSCSVHEFDLFIFGSVESMPMISSFAPAFEPRLALPALLLKNSG
jgi:hypothetical protein